jgi:hypothetical protein
MARHSGGTWPPRFPPAPAGREQRTLQEIEGVDWGPPPYDSYLVETCHALRHKPVGTFSVEDLRIMIGQQSSLPILLPIALEALESDPLAEGDLFAGDLLSSVVAIEDPFWCSHPQELRRVRGVAERVLGLAQEPSRVGPASAPTLELVERVRAFLAR